MTDTTPKVATQLPYTPCMKDTTPKVATQLPYTPGYPWREDGDIRLFELSAPLYGSKHVVVSAIPAEDMQDPDTAVFASDAHGVPREILYIPDDDFGIGIADPVAELNHFGYMVVGLPEQEA